MKLFAADYDGTLFQNDQVDPYTLEMIANFKAAGNIFVIATGRSIGSILSQAKIHQIPFDYIIGNNGSLAINHKEELLFIKLMEFSIVQQIVELLPKDTVSYYGVSDGFNVGLHDYLSQEERQYNNIVDINELMKGKNAVGIFVRFINQFHAQSYAKMLNQQFPLVIKAYNFFDYVDILNYGVTKRTGIQLLLDNLNLDVDVYTMGDSFNDIPMIKGFNGFGVTSGEAEVKEVATLSFDTVGQALAYLMD